MKTKLKIKIIGRAGAGKTRAAVVIAKALREAGYEVKHIDNSEAICHAEKYINQLPGQPQEDKKIQVNIESF